MIGALAGGGGEDLAYVEFPAGAANAFAAGQEDKLSKIAKALNERPGLRLDIAGKVDPAADAEALHSGRSYASWLLSVRARPLGRARPAGRRRR